jgi:hypothetical protein
MNTPTFSFFKPPIKNTTPYKERISLADVYLYLTGTLLKEKTETLRRITDQAANREYKAANHYFVTFSGSFRYRNEKGLIEHSGLMVFDFDHLPDVEALKMQLLKDKHFETELLFTSPNGNGLKWVIAIDATRYSHSQWFGAVSRYIATTYHVEVDKSGRDVCRVCFLCYDPEAFLHPRHGQMDRFFPADIWLVSRTRFDVEKWLPQPEPRQQTFAKPKTETRLQHEVEVVLRRVEAFGIDLTCNYEDWLKLGFSLADGFSESGREYFHRISRFNAGYQVTECDRQFTKCLQGKRTGITIKTFFAAAKDAGINIKI